MKTRRHARSYRLTEDDEAILERLMAETGLSKTAVLRLALREFFAGRTEREREANR